MGFIQPRDSEGHLKGTGYDRSIRCPVLVGSVPIEYSLLSPGQTVAFAVDGTVVTPSVVADANGVARSELDSTLVPDGSVLLECRTSTGALLGRQFPVHVQNGPPLTGPRDIWTRVTVYELVKGYTYGIEQVRYPGAPPPLTGAPMKSLATPLPVMERDPATWRTIRLTRSQDGFNRRWSNHPIPGTTETGIVSAASRQMYAYDIETRERGRADGTYVQLIDGPRNVATFGHATKVIWSPAGNGFYGLSVNGGRLWFVATKDLNEYIRAGSIITLAGLRHKFPAENFPNHEFFNAPKKQVTDREWFAAQMDWAHTFPPGENPHFSEPWGIAELRTPGAGPDGYDYGLHWFVVTDTLHHRLVFVDHYPAHEPGGKSACHTLVGDPTGTTPGPLCDHPWWVGVLTITGQKWLVWNNVGDHSWARMLIDPTTNLPVPASAERWWRPALADTISDGATGTSLRVTPKVPSLNQAHSWWHREERPFSSACIAYPQDCDLTSDGNLIVSSKATFGLYVLDPEAGTVRSLVDTVERADNTNRKQDIQVAVDRNGWVGPKDDIFFRPWIHISERYDIAGNVVQAMNRGTPHGGDYGADSGPRRFWNTPTYPMALGIGPGLILDINTNSEQGSIHVAAQPTDPDFVPVRASYERGLKAMAANPRFHLHHGPRWLGQLGYPTRDDMAAQGKEATFAYLAEWGFNAAQAEDIWTVVAWEAQDNADAAVPVPDPVDPDPDPVDPELEGDPPVIEYLDAIAEGSWPSSENPPDSYHLKFKEVPITGPDRLLLMAVCVRDGAPVSGVLGAPLTFAGHPMTQLVERHNIRQPGGAVGGKATGRGVHWWGLANPPEGTFDLPFRVGVPGSPDKSGRACGAIYVVQGGADLSQGLAHAIRAVASEEHFRFPNDLENNPGATSIAVDVPSGPDDLILAAAAAHWTPTSADYPFPLQPAGEVSLWERHRGPATPDGGTVWGAGSQRPGADGGDAPVGFSIPDAGSLVLAALSIRAGGGQVVIDPDPVDPDPDPDPDPEPDVTVVVTVRPGQTVRVRIDEGS